MAVRSDAQERKPIAVVGMGCRVPGADNTAAYWDLLMAERSAVTEVPSNRWTPDADFSRLPERLRACAQWGAFVADAEAFDASLLGVTPREARTMDPQHGVLLEVTWQALEQGGIAPSVLKTRRVGVFVGIGTCDYDREVARHLERVEPGVGLGTSYSICANRISYAFGLRGPSVALDSACSSSLIALHLACQSLWAGETELCLAGGVHLMLSPIKSLQLAAEGLLSPDGQCKCFSERANGYVRGEGAGIVALMPLEAAVAGGLRISGLVLGSAINHNGISNGLSGPSGTAQQELIRWALERAGCMPQDVDYVEAHALGTRIGDEIELRALGEVFGTRGDKEPLVVGSVKGNVGHLEAAAGVISFIKVMLAFEHGIVPKTLGAVSVAERWENHPAVKLASHRSPWPGYGELRRASVSSFSFGGSNAHVVVESAPQRRRTDGGLNQVLVLPISANSAAALTQLATRYVSYLDGEDRTAESFADVCYTAATGRQPLPFRMAVIARDCVEAAESLRAALGGPDCDAVIYGEVFPGRRPGRRWVCGALRVDLREATQELQSTHSRWILCIQERGLIEEGNRDIRAAHIDTLALAAVMAQVVGAPRSVCGDPRIAVPFVRLVSSPAFETSGGALTAVTNVAAAGGQEEEVWHSCGTRRAQDHVAAEVPERVTGSDVARALALAYVTGSPVDWRPVFGSLNRVTIPLYPFERRVYWRPSASVGSPLRQQGNGT